jgi:hypothetical protein
MLVLGAFVARTLVHLALRVKRNSACSDRHIYLMDRGDGDTLGSIRDRKSHAPARISIDSPKIGGLKGGGGGGIRTLVYGPSPGRKPLDRLR